MKRALILDLRPRGRLWISDYRIRTEKPIPDNFLEASFRQSKIQKRKSKIK